MSGRQPGKVALVTGAFPYPFAKRALIGMTRPPGIEYAARSGRSQVHHD